MLHCEKSPRVETLFLKVTQSHKATQNIIKSVGSIRDMLLDPNHPVASQLRKDQLKKITLLASLANDQYGEGFRNPADTGDGGQPDERSTKAIKGELATY